MASSQSLAAMRPTAATIRMPYYSGQNERLIGKMSTTEDTTDQDKKDEQDDDSAPRRNSIDLQDLPIELISLTDSFIDSLGQKVHPTPPNIERLSQLFQEFYNVASSHVETHIKALATRQMRRDPSSSTNNNNRMMRVQQMMTAEELASRKKSRQLLESRRFYLEEAVERRLCEGIYHRIYRHPSTQDEAHDDKLRSKTAALSLVGIGLSDLGVDIETDSRGEKNNKTEDESKKLVSAAHQHLIAMSECRYPLGKLNRLRAVHRTIVDALSQIRPTASSADEVLPLLIYSLISLPPQHLHITSDLHFVQHFRHAPKLQGESAYCLTNLEAAISFLQTVDLATLREDERLDGPPRSAASTPRAETFPPAYPTTPSKDPSVGLRPPSVAVVTTRGRRLSDLVNTPAQAFGAASGAVFTTADQGLKTISASLGDSYAFLVAKVRDGSTSTTTTTTTTSSSSSSLSSFSTSSSHHTKNVVTLLPRTLDDARKLVTTPPPPPPPPSQSDDDVKQPTTTPRDEASLEESTSKSSTSPSKVSSSPSKVSSSPSKSSSSPSKSTSSPSKSTSSPSPAKKTTVLSDDVSKPQSPAAVLDQVRSIGSSFNPMARLSGISIRRFGRTSSAAATATASPSSSSSISSPAKELGGAVEPPFSDGGELTEAFPDLADSLLPPKELPPSPRPQIQIQTQSTNKVVAPPIRRFIDVQDPSDLRIGEVQDLLLDYRRLASALRNLGALDES